jgi:hypothetical protein
MIRDDFVSRGELIYNQTLSIEIFRALYNVYDMLWSVHPLLIDCRQAPDDFTTVVKRRFDDFSDIKVILTNAIFNYPKVIDTARELKDFFTSDEQVSANEAPYEAGFGCGRMVYYLFTDNELTNMVDPAAGMDMPGYSG